MFVFALPLMLTPWVMATKPFIFSAVEAVAGMKVEMMPVMILPSDFSDIKDPGGW